MPMVCRCMYFVCIFSSYGCPGSMYGNLHLMCFFLHCCSMQAGDRPHLLQACSAPTSSGLPRWHRNAARWTANAFSSFPGGLLSKGCSNLEESARQRWRQGSKLGRRRGTSCCRGRQVVCFLASNEGNEGILHLRLPIVGYPRKKKVQQSC